MRKSRFEQRLSARMVGLALALFPLTLLAVTDLVYDIEPNDQPHQAILFGLPSSKDAVRIIGELADQDQDGYRLVVDDDLAGRRFNLSLKGRGGALTRLDVFDLTELADGRGRIPEALSRRPELIFGLKTTDGSRPVQRDALLFAPGVYVLGVSHSGGEGAYSVEISHHDERPVSVVADGNASDRPHALSTRGPTVVWTQGETWFGFEITEQQAGQAWNLSFQSAMGRAAELTLFDPSDQALLSLSSAGDQVLHRPGLQLAPGSYRIRTEQSRAGVQWFELVTGAPLAEGGREVEPNDNQPNLIEFGQPIVGRFDERDQDRLAFEVSEDDATRVFDLELEVDPGAEVEACLVRSSMGLDQCARGANGMTALRRLALEPGLYQLRMHDRRRIEADWALAWVDRGPVRPGEEVEPNNDSAHAVALHERGFGRGNFEGREVDHWRFSVTGEARLWRAQLQGENLLEMSLLNASGKVLMSERANGRQRIRLDNLFLLPGDYYLAATGTDADYILRLVDLGPPPEGMEMEPNDQVSNANRLRFGIEHFGTLSETNDVDRWRFKLNGHERIRLTVQAPVDGRITGTLDAGDETRYVSRMANQDQPGAAMVWDLFLPPGDYSLALSPREVSDDEYKVRLERLDFLDSVADREPNDSIEVAAPFPANARVHGQVGSTRENEDWYRLPSVNAPVTLALTRPDGVRMQLFADSAPGQDLFQYDRESRQDQATLSPGQAHWLKVHGNGSYDFDLAATFGITPPASQLPPSVSLRLAADRIQAFSPWAQQLSGELEVRNPGEPSRTLRLQAHVTDARWQIELETDEVTLAGGQARTVPILIWIPADTAAEPAPRVSVRASDALGQAGALIDLKTDVDAPPMAPVFHWSVPEPLRGGFNAAALAFGAQPVGGPMIDEDKVDATEVLFDGLARLGRWTEYKIGQVRGSPGQFAQPTVELAGSDPVPVRGFLINPTASLVPHGFLHRFQVAVSLDGVQFETIFEGELEAIAEEQAFVLDQPVLARQVRLIPLSRQFAFSGYSELRLGEFKVVAEPGWRPRAEAFNLADPDFGGHLVWADPWIRGSAFDRSLLLRDQKAPLHRLHGQNQAQVVIGFQHARAALIDRIEIMPLSAVDATRQPTGVSVAVAEESPAGPWRVLVETELNDGAAELVLDAPVWARYVRLGFAAAADASHLQLPDQIAIFESGQQSVLGEWGFHDDVGPWEAASEPRWQTVAGEPNNASRETAEVLSPGATAIGRALLDTYSSWYRLQVPAGQNQIKLEVSGRPSVEADLRLFDPAGNQVELHTTEQMVTHHRREAYVEAGQSYWLEIFEPPRSVIFAWDTSASVAIYEPFIANALTRYAETIRPGRDEVNLLPFGRSGPLLANWQGHAYPLMKMLAGYPQETSSSEAERAVAVAARQMSDRPGKKGLVLLTDAATTTDASLWPALMAGQPQVFAMKLSSEGALANHPHSEIDLMQDWARVRGGHFSYVTSFGALDHGFERAVARLKAPVDFAVTVSYEWIEDPTPASISVLSSDIDAPDPGLRGAVEIILDASGSMLKRMGDRRRIDIAKAAIRRTVEDTLPEGIPLALRVYGHREAGSCRTDLEIPLSPLDQADFLERLAPIEAINLARTPIAASLAAVASDLRESTGRRLVVLLTDGEETCEGDPAAEIERLREAGFDVRINIVGFAIDDEELKGEFAEWARLGGGEYLDAGEAESLGEAMARALQLPFLIINESGETIARGLVDGEPAKVPPGRYQVRVEGANTRHFRNVSAAPGESVALRLEADD